MTALTQLQVDQWPRVHQGKVRDVFDVGEAFLLVASDRLSAFDVVLPTGIPGKGKILTQLSAFWFEKLAHLCPTHLIASSKEDLEAHLGPLPEELLGRSMLAKKCKTIPIECVARGFLAGSWWKDYRAGNHKLFGVDLPAGLLEASALPEPVFTPATKAAEGHDENISYTEAANQIGREKADFLMNKTLEIFAEASKHAAECGFILADTKFEFGDHETGILWIDEALTPDSSRYWERATYAEGTAPESFDKQFVRNYLETLSWDKTYPGPSLPDSIIQQTQARYLEAFHRLTGRVLDL